MGRSWNTLRKGRWTEDDGLKLTDGKICVYSCHSKYISICFQFRKFEATSLLCLSSLKSWYELIQCVIPIVRICGGSFCYVTFFSQIKIIGSTAPFNKSSVLLDTIQLNGVIWTGHAPLKSISLIYTERSPLDSGQTILCFLTCCRWKLRSLQSVRVPLSLTTISSARFPTQYQTQHGRWPAPTSSYP